MITPSAYQQAIFDWITFGEEDAAVNAVAGSGKTTTLVEGSKLLAPGSAMFLAFNRSIVSELSSRLPHDMRCMTINSLGHRALARHLGRDVRIEFREWKYSEIVKDVVASNPFIRDEDRTDVKEAVSDLVGFAQSTLAPPTDEQLDSVADHFGIDFPAGVQAADIFEMVRETLDLGEAMAREGILGYEDQVWLAVKWRCRTLTAEFVMVDECQDLSAAKLELVLAAKAPGGRILFVGDPRQAIYGFAGADSNSFANIVERTRAVVLPLSVSYRCPQRVVDHAKKIVSAIEAAPGAQPGVLSAFQEKDIAARLAPGDLVLSRRTAPLIRLCVKLMAARIPARVRGRDIGKMIVKTLKTALRSLSFDDADVALDVYLEAKTAQLSQRKRGAALIESLKDKIDGVRACLDAFPECNSIAEFSDCVDSLFREDLATVDLSTVHRAKGLEADRVFIIEPERLPLRWRGQQSWELVQEYNLKYVAVTRARRELHYVMNPDTSVDDVPVLPEKELALL